MPDVIVERDTLAIKIFVVVMFFFSVIYFYFLRNGLALIVPLGLASIAYWIEYTKPLEYFWASSKGIEFHIRKNELTLIHWSEIKDIYIEQDLDDINEDMIVIELVNSLKNKPLYFMSENFFIHALYLQLGKRSKRIHNELQDLKKESHAHN